MMHICCAVNVRIEGKLKWCINSLLINLIGVENEGPGGCLGDRMGVLEKDPHGRGVTDASGRLAHEESPQVDWFA